MFLYYKSILFISLLAGAFLKVTAYNIKLTDVHCESFNDTISEVKECKLRTLKDGVSAIDMKGILKYPLNDIQLNAEIYKKSTKYAPFLFNQTIDFCELMVKSDNLVFTKVHGLFKDFSNINHTCPYEGELVISGLYIKPMTNLPIPIPNGDYLLYLRWITGNVKFYETKAYFALSV